MSSVTCQQTFQSSALGSGRRSQTTIARPVELRGLSLFHGYDTKVRLLPAEECTGIRFRRMDLSDSPIIPATFDFVRKVPRRTVIGVSDTVCVETIEHLMAALAGLQLDNCLVEISSPEVPAYDGSCRAFCDEILDAGLQSLSADIQPYAVNQHCEVHSKDGRQSIQVRPYMLPCPAFTYHFDYGARAAVSAQQFSIEITPESFYSEIAAARTFVLDVEIAALKKMGYGSHLTLQDLVVIGPGGPIENRYRWPDECVRHKILDCIGDLALSGAPFHGHVMCSRSGHHLNHEMARTLTMMNQSADCHARTAA